jgi:deazaflavin-dependent oxidoreductase (nitroreductase family)
MQQRPAGGNTRRKPGLFARWFFRVPLVLYRLGLGALMFGQLRLTTAGRTSGRPRRTVVDVVGHDEASDTYYVVSAYGQQSDWYRNLQKNPSVHVQIRRHQFPARAATMPGEEAEEVFVDFWRRHRLYVRTMLGLIGLEAASEEEARAAVAEMKIVALYATPHDE